MQTERLLKNMADQVKELQIKLGYVRETVRLYYPASSLNALLGMDFSDDRAGREALRTALEEALREGVLESERNIEERAAEQTLESGGRKEADTGGGINQETAIMQESSSQIEQSADISDLKKVVVGKVTITLHGDRFEINVPPEGVEYIHRNYKATSFLQELVELFQKHHHCTLEEICEVFARAVKVEKSALEEKSSLKKADLKENDLKETSLKENDLKETGLKETSLKGSVQNKGLSAELELNAPELGYICEKMPAGSDFDYVIYFKDLSVDEYYYCIKMEMGHTIYHRFMKEDYEALFS